MKNAILIAIRSVILCLVIFFTNGCDDWLPPPTKSGNNSFGCFINGEKFVPKGSTLFSMGSFSNLSVEYKGETLSIDAHNIENEPSKHIYIHLENVSKKGRYNINYDFDPQNSSGTPNYGIYNVENDSYNTSADLPGHVYITKLNTSKRIISGTFEFKGRDVYNKSKAVEITKGRFDLSY